MNEDGMRTIVNVDELRTQLPDMPFDEVVALADRLVRDSFALSGAVCMCVEEIDKRFTELLQQTEALS